MGGQKGGMLWSPNMQLYNRGPIIAFPHPRTTLCTFYKHSQSQADLSRGIGDPHWEAATGVTQLDPGLSIGLPQTLKLSAAHRPRVVCWSVLVCYHIWRIREHLWCFANKQCCGLVFCCEGGTPHSEAIESSLLSATLSFTHWQATNRRNLSPAKINVQNILICFPFTFTFTFLG